LQLIVFDAKFVKQLSSTILDVPVVSERVKLVCAKAALLRAKIAQKYATTRQKAAAFIFLRLKKPQFIHYPNTIRFSQLKVRER